MNTWQIIREECEPAGRIGSNGYLVQLARQARLFSTIADNLKDKASAMESFNADKDVTKALLVAGQLNEL